VHLVSLPVLAACHRECVENAFCQYKLKANFVLLLLWVCFGLSVCSSQWVWSVAMSVCLSVCWWQRVGGTDNLSCLLVLPPHRGAGYTQLMIALSKYMSHVHLTQRFCWSLPRCNCELSWKWLNQSRCRLGVRTWVGGRNHVLGGCPDSPGEGAFLWVPVWCGLLLKLFDYLLRLCGLKL